MKLRNIALLVAALFAAPAVAADLPARTYATPPATFAQLYSWTGFYVGLNGGYVLNSSIDYVHRINSNFGGVGGTYTNDFDGWTGGAHAGFNYQMGVFVVGLEGSAAFANVNGNYDFTQYHNNTTSKIDRLFTITPRIGVSVFDNSVLLYVKGGWAGADVVSGQAYTPLIGKSVFWSNGQFQSGWTVGAGFDYALTQHVILGLEYDFVRLNDSTHSAVDSTGTLTQISAKPDLHQVRANISYKF